MTRARLLLVASLTLALVAAALASSVFAASGPASKAKVYKCLNESPRHLVTLNSTTFIADYYAKYPAGFSNHYVLVARAASSSYSLLVHKTNPLRVDYKATITFTTPTRAARLLTAAQRAGKGKLAFRLGGDFVLTTQPHTTLEKEVTLDVHSCLRGIRPG